MQYKNKENGKVVNLLETSDKYKTVMIEYENGMTQSMASSMFKKLWKPINKKEEK